MLIVIIYLLRLGGPQTAGGIYMCVWLTGWSVGVSALLFGVFKAWQNVLHPQSSGSLSGVTGVGQAIFITLFSIPFVFFEGMGFTFLFKLTSPALVVFLVSACALHAVFFHLLKAPTFAAVA